MSTRHYATERGRFTDAIRYGNVDQALQAAEAMRECGHPVNSHGALELVVVMVRKRHPLAAQAATRWLRMFEDEGGRGVEAEIAASALKGLASRKANTAWRCEKVLFLLEGGVRE